jgi:hypothetical protein
MQKQEVEAYLGKLVTVELISGPVLTGTLRRSSADPVVHFDVLHASEKWTAFGTWDVRSIQPAHPAEQLALEKECTCPPRAVGSPLVSEGSLRCPIHGPDMSDEADYRAYRDWRAHCFSAIRQYIATEDAGAWLKVGGDFEKVVFQISAAEKPAGDEGKVIVTIGLTERSSGKQRTTLERNWRDDFAADVARDAIAAHKELLSGG